jgi:hypothetical protein
MQIVIRKVLRFYLAFTDPQKTKNYIQYAVEYNIGGDGFMHVFVHNAFLYLHNLTGNDADIALYENGGIFIIENGIEDA